MLTPLLSLAADTFIHTSMPVVEYYRKQGKVVDVRLVPSRPPPHLLVLTLARSRSQIDSSKTIDEVYEDIKRGIAPVVASS